MNSIEPLCTYTNRKYDEWNYAKTSYARQWRWWFRAINMRKLNPKKRAKPSKSMQCKKRERQSGFQCNHERTTIRSNSLLAIWHFRICRGIIHHKFRVFVRLWLIRQEQVYFGVIAPSFSLSRFDHHLSHLCGEFGLNDLKYVCFCVWLPHRFDKRTNQLMFTDTHTKLKPDNTQPCVRAISRSWCW